VLGVRVDAPPTPPPRSWVADREDSSRQQVNAIRLSRRLIFARWALRAKRTAKAGLTLATARRFCGSTRKVLYIYLSICLPTYLSIHLSLSLSLYLSIYLAVYPSVYLSIHLSIHSSIYISI